MGEVLDALEKVDLEAPWEAVAGQILPVLPRRRPLPPGMDEPVRRSWPPGIETTFGLDIGPAFLYVGGWVLGKWGVSEDRVASRALANVQELSSRRRRFELVSERMCGVPAHFYQSRDGWASTLLLLPSELHRVFGEESSLILTPMRDLLISLPVDADRGFAAWLLDEFATADPNGLAVPIMALVDGALSLAPSAAEPDQPRPSGLRAGRPH